MAGRVLSIEIGNTITRICEIDFRVKEPKVYKYFSIPTPMGVVEDGFVQVKPEFAAAIKKALNEHKVKSKQVVFTVTSSKIVTREISLPAIKMNQVGNYIKANANDYFPIDLGSYELAHVVLSSEKGEDNKDKYRVLAIAAGKDLVAGYAKFASACGLKMVSLDYSGNSVYQIMRSECGEDTKLVIKIEDNFTIASIISNQCLMLQRNIAYGFERAVQAYMDMADSYAIKPEEAFEELCVKGHLNVTLGAKRRLTGFETPAAEVDSETEKRNKITATFGQMISNLARLIELYNSKWPLQPVSEVVLVGLGAEIEGLMQLLSNELHLPVKVIRNLEKVTNFRTIGDESLGKYIAVAGASLAPVNLLSDDGKSRGKSGKKVPYALFTTMTYIVFLVVVGIMLTMAYLPLWGEQVIEKELKRQEASYAEAEAVHRQYIAMSDFYHSVNNTYKLTEHSNDELVAFLQELEEKMPADLVVTEFYSDAEMARMELNVPNMEQVATIFQTLREFESLIDVGTTSIKDGDNAPFFYTFEVYCYYKPILIDENTEAATQEASEAEAAEATAE